MTQLVVASTLFGATTAAAAADAGLLPGGGERVLLVVNNAPAPELTLALDEVPGAGPVLARFDRVVHLNDLIAPLHPSDWRPGTRERPMLETLLRKNWQLADDELTIVCESIWVNPAQALVRVFHAAAIVVYADGLMSYGPTRNKLPLDVVQRLDGLLHLDLVPGLRPVLLSEYGIETTIIPSASFRNLIEEVASSGASRGAAEAEEAAEENTGRPLALIVGQYLAALGLITREEEAELHAQMLRQAAAAGAEVVHFKPHPSAPPGLLGPLHEAARQAGVELEIIQDAIPVEVMLASGRYSVLGGCFSTALATAKTIFGIRTVAVGTGQFLQELRPYANSNRVPLVLIDAMHRPEGLDEDIGTLQELVDAVAYAMQPEQLAPWRSRARRSLAAMTATERERYFDAARLRQLDLPGAPKVSGLRKHAQRKVDAFLRHPRVSGLDQRTRSWKVRRAVGRIIHR